MKSAICLALLPLLTLLAGCHTMDAPPNFVAVERHDLGAYVVRDISADGVVVGLRTQDNPKHGTLEFWSQAVTNELATRGYKAVKSEDVRSDSGTAGKLLHFTTSQRGSEFAYLLAVYVTDSTVLLAEAGGKADAVAPRAAGIRKSLLSARRSDAASTH